MKDHADLPAMENRREDFIMEMGHVSNVKPSVIPSFGLVNNGIPANGL